MITAFAVVRVIASKDNKYREGDLLLVPSAPVAEYCIVPSSQILRKIDAASGISLPDYLSSLGWFSTHPMFFIYWRINNYNPIIKTV